ncbi:MAG: SUMF1/EgtB/PvdO family nonheme iron enzyme [Candidatus Sericytochromatia bacterium]|nr:SUMF1/EgtB/PvdO family nonheme iron enzyme [Candidatus Tanganyikabacteria bacterium]
MAGNAWEWVWDWYGSYPGAATDPLGAVTGTTRVVRGGSWGHTAQYARAAARLDNTPGYRYITLGVRLARTRP